MSNNSTRDLSNIFFIEIKKHKLNNENDPINSFLCPF